MSNNDEAQGRDGLVEQLDRLAKLVRGAGGQTFLRGPIVLPDNTWFPERWTPDLESVRRLSLRLLAFAGLGDLDAECALYDEHRGEWIAGAQPDGQMPTHEGAAAFFLGIDSGCAYFGVELHQLHNTEVLVGVMAREVAHVWRRVNALEVTDLREEEELTDLTTVVLGFGVLTANAAYRYEASGHQPVVSSRIEYSHRVTGYLGADLLASLLAVQCVLRGVDVRPVRSRLGATQRDAFDSAMRTLDLEALVETLGLSEETVVSDLGAPPPLEIRPGRVARAIHATSETAWAALSGRDGLLDVPLPFDLYFMETRYHWLASFGRPHMDGGWLFEFVLVEDPAYRRVLLIIAAFSPGKSGSRVYGAFGDQFVGRKRDFVKTLERLFDVSYPGHLSLVEAQSFVRANSPRIFDSDDLMSLMKCALLKVEPFQLHADLTDLESDSSSLPRVRAEQDRQQVVAAPPEFDFADWFKQWWNRASNPAVVNDEYTTWSSIDSMLASRIAP